MSNNSVVDGGTNATSSVAPLPEKPRSQHSAARPSGQFAVTRRITRLLPLGDVDL